MDQNGCQSRYQNIWGAKWSHWMLRRWKCFWFMKFVGIPKMSILVPPDSCELTYEQALMSKNFSSILRERGFSGVPHFYGVTLESKMVSQGFFFLAQCWSEFYGSLPVCNWNSSLRGGGTFLQMECTSSTTLSCAPWLISTPYCNTSNHTWQGVTQCYMC